MSVIIDGTAGITTPGLTNSGTLSQSGAATMSNTLQTATTIGVGAATPANTGAGITFPATQSASSNANTLDDYEEGTWTPVFTFETPGTLSVTYAGQAGYYTKIGNSVTCRLQLIVAPGNFAKGTASGQLKITGLPFSTSNIFNQYLDLAASISDISTGSLCFANVDGTVLYFESMSVSGTRVTRDSAVISAATFAASNAGYITISACITYLI